MKSWPGKGHRELVYLNQRPERKANDEMTAEAPTEVQEAIEKIVSSVTQGKNPNKRSMAAFEAWASANNWSNEALVWAPGAVIPYDWEPDWEYLTAAGWWEGAARTLSPSLARKVRGGKALSESDRRTLTGAIRSYLLAHSDLLLDLEFPAFGVSELCGAAGDRIFVVVSATGMSVGTEETFWSYHQTLEEAKEWVQNFGQYGES